MSRKPTEAAILAEAVELCRGGMSPEAAAAALEGKGRAVSYRTIYRALKLAPGAGKAVAGAVEASPEMIAKVRAYLAQLSPAQQGSILEASGLDAMRREAIARALAPFPEAAASVARELRSLEQSLR